MKRLLYIFTVLLLTAVAARAQYAEYPPEYVSRMNPGKIVRSYDQYYINGEAIKSYKLVNVLDMMEYSRFARARRQYKASEYIAFAGALTTVAGGAFIALHRSFPDTVPNGVGQALAIGGATALFCVAIPMDFNAQRKLRDIAREYNKTH